MYHSAGYSRESRAAARAAPIAVTLYEKFKRGDLVFGLAKPRDVVIHKLAEHGFTHTYSNALNSSVVEMVVTGAVDAESLKKLDETQLKHFHFLSKHRDYLIRKPGKAIPARPGEPEIGAAYRRACKLLLINRDPERTCYAHVVINEIDWMRVCDKKKSGFGVTDSEMRAAYRDYCRYGKNPFILFYDSKLNLLKDPPWTDPRVAEYFRLYDASKHLAASKGLFSAAGKTLSESRSFVALEVGTYPSLPYGAGGAVAGSGFAFTHGKK